MDVSVPGFVRGTGVDGTAAPAFVAVRAGLDGDPLSGSVTDASRRRIAGSGAAVPSERGMPLDGPSGPRASGPGATSGGTEWEGGLERVNGRGSGERPGPGRSQPIVINQIHEGEPPWLSDSTAPN